jgi:hypothetical protein
MPHNLLVIELKKKSEGSDPEKACEYTDEPKGERKYQYQYGLALSRLDTLKTLNMVWCENGKKRPLKS